MAITYAKDIPDFTTKVKQITDITELETTVSQLSGSMLEVQGDVSTLAGAVTALDSEVDEVASKQVSFLTIYDATNGYFKIPDTIQPPREGHQITITCRNTNTGALYVLWYDSSVTAFKVAKILDGAAPVQGNTVAISYIA